VVQSCAKFLLRQAASRLDEEHVEFLTIIQAYSGFMLQMVDDLLDVSAIEAGELKLDPKPVDLVALVQRNVALNRILAESKQIRLSFHHAGQYGSVVLDEGKVEQVLNNLISNAVKFSHPGSSVEVSVVQRAGSVVVSVKDEGQGIPPDELDKLFHWFGRTSVRSTEGERSTGLGLAIAQRIVMEHQGEIWVESEVGVGSTFHFSLPLQATL
jgi:signal transduction histidine kinase